MLSEPTCYKRNCINFIGVDQPDDTEATERVICKAYPKGIPADIAYGNDKHLKVRSDQKNKIVFEKDKK